MGRLYSLVYKGEVKTWMILLLISLSFKWEGKGRSVSKRVEETFQVKIFTSRLNIVGDTRFFYISEGIRKLFIF